MIRSNFIRLISLVLFFVSSAFALDVQRFNPVTDQYEGFTNPGSSTLNAGAFQLALFYNYVDDPLEFNQVGFNNQVSRIVSNFNTLTLTPNFGITPWLSLSASIPFNLTTNLVNNLPILNFVNEDNFSFGDAKVYLKFRLSDNQKNKIGFAVQPVANIPMDTDLRDHFNKESYTLGGNMIADTWLGSTSYLGLNVGGHYRFTDEDLLGILESSHFLNYGLSLVQNFSKKKNTDVFVELNGRTELENPFDSGQTTPLEALLGLRHRMFKHKLTGFLGAGRGLSNGYSAPDFRVFAGLQFSHNKDKEGEIEKKPEVLPIPKEEEKPNIAQVFVKVYDEEKNPLVAKITVRNQDGDIVAESKDTTLRKNLIPADYDIYVEKNEHTDAQKTITLKKGKRSTQNMILGKIKKQGEKIEFLGNILFNFNKASLQEASFETLDNVIDVMQRHLEVKSVRVEAHTDSKGSALYNLNLSNARAKSVMDYLIAGGVDSSRLVSVGLGEGQPIASNETDLGRAKNRRVEFTILQSEGNTVKTTR